MLECQLELWLLVALQNAKEAVESGRCWGRAACGESSCTGISLCSFGHNWHCSCTDSDGERSVSEVCVHMQNCGCKGVVLLMDTYTSSSSCATELISSRDHRSYVLYCRPRKGDDKLLEAVQNQVQKHSKVWPRHNLSPLIFQELCWDYGRDSGDDLTQVH